MDFEDETNPFADEAPIRNDEAEGDSEPATFQESEADIPAPIADLSIEETTTTTTGTATEAAAATLTESSAQEAEFGGAERAVGKEPTPPPRTTSSTAASPSPFSSGGKMKEINLKGSATAYEVSVTNPEKHGDGMSAYIAYTVVTKNFNGKSELKVTRRFNHFQHLHDVLAAKYPAIIVPPVPEKQTMGRFAPEFIESRRVALEKCLQRILSHETLASSPELAQFLEVDNYESTMQKKSKKGIFGMLAGSVTETLSTAQTAFSKIPETDSWFENRQSQLESLDFQLKGLIKCVETLIKQRKDLGNAGGEFGESIVSLGNSEFNKPLSSALVHFGEMQTKLKVVHIDQANADSSNLESTIDEYIRIIASTKVVLNNRAKVYHTWKSNEQTLSKKRDALEKARMDPKKAGKVPTFEMEVEEAERTVEKNKQEFDDFTVLVRSELEKFDEQKLLDFQTALQKFVEHMIDSQKKIISMWEEFLPEIQAL